MKSKIFYPMALLTMFIILACNSNQSDLPSELRNKLPEEYRANIDTAIQKAGDNKAEILRFLESADKKIINSAAFIITNMPGRDLQTLSAEFLTENLKYSRLAVEKSNWAEKISPELFNNYILPYANINERRDQW
jgi:cation transport regulator ChaB